MHALERACACGHERGGVVNGMPVAIRIFRTCQRLTGQGNGRTTHLQPPACSGRSTRRWKPRRSTGGLCERRRATDSRLDRSSADVATRKAACRHGRLRRDPVIHPSKSTQHISGREIVNQYRHLNVLAAATALALVATAASAAERSDRSEEHTSELQVTFLSRMPSSA